MSEARDLGSPVRFFEGSTGRGPLLDLGVDPVSAVLPDLPEPEPEALERIAETGLDDPDQLSLLGPDLEVVADEIAAADEVSRIVSPDIAPGPDGAPTGSSDIPRPSGKVPPA